MVYPPAWVSGVSPMYIFNYDRGMVHPGDFLENLCTSWILQFLHNISQTWKSNWNEMSWIITLLREICKTTKVKFFQSDSNVFNVAFLLFLSKPWVFRFTFVDTFCILTSIYKNHFCVYSCYCRSRFPAHVNCFSCFFFH